jgi:hypothetical protein
MESVRGLIRKYAKAYQLLNDRFWHEADLSKRPRDVCSVGWNGHAVPAEAFPVLTHTGSRPAGNGASGRVHSGHPPLPDIGRSFGGSDALRVNTSVRGEVVDLAARDTDIH